MIRFKVFLCCLILNVSNAHSKSYDVYDSGFERAYILEQPRPGVFLGQMMRNIGLSPDWRNRQWIQLIHQANPNTVDNKGEILYHVEKLIFPLKALQTLKGYSTIENYFTPYVEDPRVVEQEPVEPPKHVPVVKEEVLEPQVSHDSIYALDVIIGAGAEQLIVNNGIAVETTLNSEADFIGALRFLAQLNPNHQLGLSVQYQYKTYSAPSTIPLAADSDSLLDIHYDYGFRLMNEVFLRLVGQSQSSNFLQFSTGSLNLFTFWNHSAGLQLDSPLFDIGSSVLTTKVAGKYIYQTASDFIIDPGYIVDLSFEVRPQKLSSGFLIGVNGSYKSQLPESFETHNSIEVIGYIGYRF